MVAEHLFWTGAASTRTELAARKVATRARGEASIVEVGVRKSVRECESCRAGVRGLQPVQRKIEREEGDGRRREEGTILEGAAFCTLPRRPNPSLCQSVKVRGQEVKGERSMYCQRGRMREEGLLLKRGIVRGTRELRPRFSHAVHPFRTALSRRTSHQE